MEPDRHRPVDESLRLFRSWSAEFCRVDRDICLNLAEFRRVSTVEPGELVFEGELDASDIAVVGVVDLRRHAANRGWPVADQARQQVGLRIEIQGGEEAPRPGSLYHDEVAIAEAARRSAAPVGQRLFQLARKRQLRLEPRPIQLAANQLVLAQQTAR